MPIYNKFFLFLFFSISGVNAVPSQSTVPHPELEFSQTPHEQHKGAFDIAGKILHAVGITTPIEFWAVYGSEESITHFVGFRGAIAWTDGKRICLTSKVLDYLTSNNAFLLGIAKFTLLHEYGHIEHKHHEQHTKPIDLCVRRLGEFEADQAVYSRMTIEELLLCRSWIEHRDPVASAIITRNADLYPSLEESIMMVDEELEFRKTGKRPTASRARISFERRNYTKSSAS